jgi:tetratricopeptide (TPR) repeat protein
MQQYEARRVTDRLLSNPLDADAHSRLGGLRLQDGRHAEAYAHLTAALMLRADLDSAYSVRAEVAFRLRRWDDAAADATRYLEKYPYDSSIRLLRAAANHRRKRDDEAAVDLGVAIEAYPQLPWLYERRAAYYDALGKHDLARADRDKALKLGANDPQTLNNQAWHLVTGPAPQRNPAKALPLIERALELSPDNAHFLNTLGVVQYRNAKYPEAVRTLEKSLAADKGRSDAFNLFFLAMCHAQRGDAAKARECFEQAVKWCDEHPDLPPNYVEELKAFRAEADELLRKRH